MFGSNLFKAFNNIYKHLPYKLKRGFWIVAALSTFVAFVELLLTGAVSLLGVTIASPGAIQEIPMVKKLASSFDYAQYVLSDQKNLLIFILSLLVALITLKMISNIILTWKQTLYSQVVSAEIGKTLFRGYLYASYLWHVTQNLPSLTVHLGWRTNVATFLLQTLVLISQLFIAFLLLSSVFLATPVVGCIVLLTTGICAAITYKFSRRGVTTLSRKIATGETTFSKITLPALQGIREVMIYQQQEAFSQMFATTSEKVSILRSKLAVVHPITPWTLELVGMCMLLIAVIYMTNVGMGIGRLTGILAMLAAVGWRLMPAMNKFVGALLQMQGTLPYIDPVLKRIEEVSEFGDSSDVKSEECPFNELIELKKVSFRYPTTPENSPDAVIDLDLKIPKGSMIGLIGSSGSGKSTVVGLLTGLFPVSAGNFYIDGLSLTSERRVSWVHTIGYVPQSTFLLNASIAENVAFSQWGQPINRKKVLQCCQMAAMDFLNDLPEGIDTVIGERGIRLSGGQVQRISIARALYEDPQMILFDEATSALDGASEQAIQQTVNTLRNKMTLVIVAHRLSTVENCDYIYWIEEGRIQKEGKPEEILPLYEKFLKKQALKMLAEQNPTRTF